MPITMTNYSRSTPNFSIESLLRKDTAYEATSPPMWNRNDVGHPYCTTAFPSTIPPLYLPMVSTEMSVHQEQVKTTAKTSRHSDDESVKDKKTSSKKRTRTAFTNHQIKKLESEFKSNRYLTISRRNELAKSLQLTDNQIKIWFQNRRTKLKRQISSDIALSLARPGHLIPCHPTSYCTQCLPDLHTTLQPGNWLHSTHYPSYIMDHTMHSFQCGSLEKIAN